MNRRTVPVPAQAVWAVLADGRTYADWVVGTSSMRRVDEGFPSVGTRLHYRVGRGPLSHDGHTEVLAVDPMRCLRLEAHAWPLGAARITITVTPGPAAGCEIAIEELPDRGPGRRMHNRLFDLMIHGRNITTLRRLERLSVARWNEGGSDQTGEARNDAAQR